MKIVIDSNILFSALIKDSKTREIILRYEDFFLFPSFVYIEMEKHKKTLLKKSKMNEKEFYELFQLILRKVLIVPNHTLLPFRKKAFDIVKEIDPDDVLFFACTLAYDNCILWSNDKKMKNQTKVKVLNTQEIIKLFEN